MTRLTEICEINSAENFPKDASTIVFFFSSIIILQILALLTLLSFLISLELCTHACPLLHIKNTNVSFLLKAMFSLAMFTLHSHEIVSSLNDMDHVE